MDSPSSLLDVVGWLVGWLVDWLLRLLRVFKICVSANPNLATCYDD
jgi:hypothetical protein